MPAPKDPTARELWKQRISASCTKNRKAECHPERKHYGLGYCKRCYWSKVGNKKPNARKSQAFSSSRRKQALKIKIFGLLGGDCVKCGYFDWRALQIDHVNGGGKKDRKGKNIISYYKGIIASIASKEGKYQLLCSNCNWIKRWENGEFEQLKYGFLESPYPSSGIRREKVHEQGS